VTRFFCVLEQRFAVAVATGGEARQSSQEAAHPAGVALMNGLDRVLDFHAEKSAKLPQVLDRPAGGRGAEPPISRIDVGSLRDQKPNHLPVAVERRDVKGRGPSSVPGAR